MSTISNRFQTKLHEFLLKLSRNFETQSVTAKTCDVNLSFWTKHLSQVKNSKVGPKVESFISEIFRNVGGYYMDKYRGHPDRPPAGRIQSALDSLPGTASR